MQGLRAIFTFTPSHHKSHGPDTRTDQWVRTRVGVRIPINPKGGKSAGALCEQAVAMSDSSNANQKGGVDFPICKLDYPKYIITLKIKFHFENTKKK